MIFLLAFAFALVVMIACYVRQRRTGDATLVDVAWAGTLALVAIFYGAATPGDPMRRALVAAMGAAWGLRLALHLYKRSVGRGEDGRYAALRARWGEKAQRNFSFVFFAQATFVLLFSLPFCAAATAPGAGLGALDFAGVAVWMLAVGGEAVADAQLLVWRSRAETKGFACRYGLWKFSRHPNYFFEWLHWFAYVVIAIPHEPSRAWMAWLGPALMLVFLYRLTGIPYTEAQALKSRADYADYQRTTSAFFPMPPKV